MFCEDCFYRLVLEKNMRISDPFSPKIQSRGSHVSPLLPTPWKKLSKGPRFVTVGPAAVFRAILELPIPNITQHGFSASAVILPRGESEKTEFSNLDQALAAPDTQIRLFGKPVIRGKRRMGVALARGSSLEEALDKAVSAANAVLVKF